MLAITEALWRAVRVAARVLVSGHQISLQLLKLVTATNIAEAYNLTFVCCQRLLVDWVT